MIVGKIGFLDKMPEVHAAKDKINVMKIQKKLFALQRTQRTLRIKVKASTK